MIILRWLADAAHWYWAICKDFDLWMIRSFLHIAIHLGPFATLAYLMLALVVVAVAVEVGGPLWIVISIVITLFDVASGRLRTRRMPILLRLGVGILGRLALLTAILAVWPFAVLAWRGHLFTEAQPLTSQYYSARNFGLLQADAARLPGGSALSDSSFFQYLMIDDDVGPRKMSQIATNAGLWKKVAQATGNDPYKLIFEAAGVRNAGQRVAMYNSYLNSYPALLDLTAPLRPVTTTGVVRYYFITMIRTGYIAQQAQGYTTFTYDGELQSATTLSLASLAATIDNDENGFPLSTSIGTVRRVNAALVEQLIASQTPLARQAILVPSIQDYSSAAQAVAAIKASDHSFMTYALRDLGLPGGTANIFVKAAWVMVLVVALAVFWFSNVLFAAPWNDRRVAAPSRTATQASTAGSADAG